MAIPNAVFNNSIGNQVKTEMVSDPFASYLLVGGRAYEQASTAFIPQFSVPVQDEIRELYRLARRRTFLISFAFMRRDFPTHAG
ncbi:hypothetical protein F4778DRAFT_733537 [Xylariomycetidae sp. FL2044]|nr:hypothetical protein F4778DRAFT_733537 [Xylariomycetidae sp. FL2044]